VPLIVGKHPERANLSVEGCEPDRAPGGTDPVGSLAQNAKKEQRLMDLRGDDQAHDFPLIFSDPDGARIELGLVPANLLQRPRESLTRH
jgi:hypothetical protein